MRDHNYFVYIVTNKHKTTIYVGVTGDLQNRVYEHEKGLGQGFTKKCNCHFLVYYEHFTHIEDAIDREKEIKNGDVKRKTN